jgi:hypothetical protein
MEDYDCNLYWEWELIRDRTLVDNRWDCFLHNERGKCVLLAGQFH